MEGETAPLGEHPGRPSQWPCPDCDGVLWEVEDENVLRFRCRVGHAWTAESLLHEQSDAVEAALWVALRSLEDRAALAEAMALRAEANGKPRSATRFRHDLESWLTSIEVLRRLVEPRAVAEQPAGEEDDG